jgi:ketosteroid isomerase-like protein
MLEQGKSSSTSAHPEVVLASLSAFNAGELERALLHFADDAECTLIGIAPSHPHVLKGKEQLRSCFKKLATQHLRIEVEILAIEVTIVTIESLSWTDSTRQLGVAPLVATGQVLIDEGKICSIKWTIHPESAAKLQAALSHAKE